MNEYQSSLKKLLAWTARQKTLPQVYEAMKRILEAKSIAVAPYRSMDYGIQFSISNPEVSGILRVYQNKTGRITIDYSLIREKTQTSPGQARFKKGKPMPSRRWPRANQFYIGYPLIGTAESGNGDYFGPLVTAGIYVDSDTAKKLRALGVRDGRVLKDKEIFDLADKIRSICQNQCEVRVVSPKDYNPLYETFRRKSQKLDSLLAYEHAAVIKAVRHKVHCTVVLTDQFARKSILERKLRKDQVTLIQMPKAEENSAVATASILAREGYLQGLRELSNELSIDLPKGASNGVIDAGRKVVGLYGEEILAKVAKLHFKTTKEILNA